MDRYELVLEIIEHPEKYSADRLSEIFSDPETKKIYNLLCKTDSAIEAAKEMVVLPAALFHGSAAGPRQSQP